MGEERQEYARETERAIEQALIGFGGTNPCPRCDHPRWFHAGFGLVPYSFAPDSRPTGSGTGWEVVMLACERCGYIVQHIAERFGVAPEPRRQGGTR